MMKTETVINLVFSGTVTISTIFYVILTWKLVKESRITRRFAETPFIVASIDFAQADRKVIIIKIKNIGLGYAQKVSFNVLKDYEWAKDDPLKKRGAFKNGIQSFPPSYELNYIIAFLYDQDSNPVSDDDFVEFEINYYDIHDHRYLNKYKLKFNEVISQGYSIPPHDTENLKAYYLSEINKQLKYINKE